MYSFSATKVSVVESGADLVFVAVAALSFVPSIMPVAVLAAHRPPQHVFRRERLHRVQHLRLFVAHGVGVERDRRLHRRQRDQLEEMVRHHVAQRTGRVVVAASLLDAHASRTR